MKKIFHVRLTLIGSILILLISISGCKKNEEIGLFKTQMTLDEPFSNEIFSPCDTLTITAFILDKNGLSSILRTIKDSSGTIMDSTMITAFSSNDSYGYYEKLILKNFETGKYNIDFIITDKAKNKEEFSIRFIVKGLENICAVSQIPPQLKDGLELWFPFCGNANDLSGNNNNGLITGATLTTSPWGYANSAYSFNCANPDFIDATDLDLNATFTIASWVYPVSEIGSIVSKYNDPNPSYELMYNNNTGYGLYGHTGDAYTDPNNTIISHVALTLNQWQHVAYVFSNGIAKLYLNGCVIYVQDSVNLPTQNDYKIRIGRSVWGGNSLCGSLDDVFIFTRALEASEIKELYQLGALPKCQ